jgi:hypothetical protein
MSTVRNFPTHGQPSAAQGSPTTVSTLTLPFKLLTPRLCSLIDGPEVEHGAHFLILYYTSESGPGLPGTRSTPSSRSPRHRRAPALAPTHVDWPPQTVDTAVPALTHPKHACQCACQSRSASGATGGLRFTFSASDNDLLASAPPVASQGSISTYRYVKFKLTHA